MIKTEERLKLIETELSEWKEELGDNFPSFLNHVLVARLIEAEEHLDFCRKMLEVVAR